MEREAECHAWKLKRLPERSPAIPGRRQALRRARPEPNRIQGKHGSLDRGAPQTSFHHLGACGIPILTPSKPSSIVKMAPHFGHLTCWSWDIPAHPKKQIVKITNAKNMLTHFLIPISLLSLMLVEE